MFTQAGAGGDEKKDFPWLLRVVQDVCAGTREDAAPPAPVPGAVDPGRRISRPWSSSGTIAAKAFAPASSACWLKGALGVKIPDTVILEKGKPKRRYFMDAEGFIQATHMKTSAELLRVLREFVRKASRPRLPAADPRPRRPSSTPSGDSAKGMSRASSVVLRAGDRPGLTRCRSECRPRSGSNASAAGCHAADGCLPAKAAPMTDVALLKYTDGTARLMSAAEAQVQMKDGGKLPREFWQDIKILQTPVQSVQAGMPTRFVTYDFDAQSASSEPQQPVPLGHLRHASLVQTSGQKPDLKATRIAAVPRKINEWLAGRRKGQVGFGLQLTSGQFEFVHDEADDTLWLVNAVRLRCKRVEISEEEAHGEQDAIDVRYFHEEEFAEVIRKEQEKLDGMKAHFGRADGTDGPKRSRQSTGSMTSHGFVLSMSDQLRGITVPTELVKFHEAKEYMNDFFRDEFYQQLTSPRPDARSGCGTRAVGLSIWFHRWVKVHRKRIRA